MTEGNEWQALRYVLDDPTLDRNDFENRMLSDTDLALAVAQVVRDIQLVQTAAASAPASFAAFHSSCAVRGDARRDVRQVPVETQGWHWSAIAALAAALLMAVGIGMRQLESLHRSTAVGNGVAEAGDAKSLPIGAVDSHAAAQVFVAEHWLAMRRDISASELFENSDLLLNADDSREALPGSGEFDSEDDEDWMLKAAREFYSQGVAS